MTLIDEETFELAQKRIATKHRPTKSEEIDLFSGLLFCGDCGNKMYPQKEPERRSGNTLIPAATTATGPEMIFSARRTTSEKVC